MGVTQVVKELINSNLDHHGVVVGQRNLMQPGVARLAFINKRRIPSEYSYYLKGILSRKVPSHDYLGAKPNTRSSLDWLQCLDVTCTADKTLDRYYEAHS